MEAYPIEYAEHNLPLVLLSGLGERKDSLTGPAIPRQESGTRLVTASPECSGDRASQLLDQLFEQDGSQRAWNATALPGPGGPLKYRMKAIGRSYTLPPRKAAPLPQSPSTEGFQNVQARNTELHSPLSPLSPGSPIYPDGVFTPMWIAKHQQQVPALFLAFFELNTGDSAARDEQIQIDISAIRTALSRSGFKTKFAAVLMSDQSILRAPELEESLSAIRRATTLDPKTGLFFMPPMSSQAEIATFVQTTLATLQPIVVDYYRDLTKHSRRKKARGGTLSSLTSPVEGGSHALSTPGWNARYEVKQGIFAEFRQEMGVAERHYSAAIEELFGSEGILETTPSWSPRWDEARLLCDGIALRVLRCQLWTSLTTGAAISWVNYKARMKDLIDRRGKGSQTYGWDAWEARWAEVMAQLTQRAALSSLQSPPGRPIDESVELGLLQVYAAPEKSFATSERLPPFHLLHHPGYWYRLAIQSAVSRREKATGIPEEDRVPPGQSPASSVAQRSKSCDTYLVPEPHEESGRDGIADIQRLTELAVHEFAARGQVRSTERLKLDLASHLASSGRYGDALDLLLPFWNDASWRADDWEKLFETLLRLLHDCAGRAGNAEVHLVSAWELLRISSDKSHLRGSDLPTYYARSWPDGERIDVFPTSPARISPISVAFAFMNRETYVGEELECQLVIRSHAHVDVAVNEVMVTLSNGRRIAISQRDEEPASSETVVLSQLSDAAEDDNGALIRLKAELNVQAEQKKAYSFALTFREAGNLRVERIDLVLQTERFRLTHGFAQEEDIRLRNVLLQGDDGLEEKALPHPDPTALLVHPKPPKMEMLVHGLRKQYYVGEEIRMDIEFMNGEAEEVTGNARALVVDQEHEAIRLHWDGPNSEEASSQKPISSLEPGSSQSATLLIDTPSEAATFEVAVEVQYSLRSDSTTFLTKTMSLTLATVAAFEARFSFGPLLHPDPWPSYFDSNAEGVDDAEGIPQRWRLGAQLRSCATEPLLVRDVQLHVSGEAEDIAFTLHAKSESNKEEVLTASQVMRRDFEINSRKLSFDDRRLAALDLVMNVIWKRDDDSREVTSSMPVPRLNLPTSEPRVLCTVPEGPTDDDSVMLCYYLENPSAHFLTFAVTMEANDEFAFSGPKYRTLSVAPLSRVRIDYRLLLHDERQDVASNCGDEERWISPLLQVVDSYYQKALRVHSGGPRVRIDEKGALSVLVQPEGHE